MGVTFGVTFCRNLCRRLRGRLFPATELVRLPADEEKILARGPSYLFGVATAAERGVSLKATDKLYRSLDLPLSRLTELSPRIGRGQYTFSIFEKNTYSQTFIRTGGRFFVDT